MADADLTIPGVLAGAGTFSITALVAVIFRQIPVIYKLRNERKGAVEKGEADENAQLRARVERLESKADQREREHAGELQLLQTKFTNVTKCLDALLMLLAAAPDKAGEHIVKIEAMRREQQTEENNAASYLAATRSAFNAGLATPTGGTAP